MTHWRLDNLGIDDSQASSVLSLDSLVLADTVSTDDKPRLSPMMSTKKKKQRKKDRT